MAEPEKGAKWWIRYVVVPLIGGGGVIAIAVALITRGPYPIHPDGKVLVSVVVTPQDLRPGDRYNQKFIVKNTTDKPITVDSVSADTFANGKLLRSTPHYFNATRHGPSWNSDPIPPKQERIIYDAVGTYTVAAGCGELVAKFTFHTSEGDLETRASYSVVCS